MVRGRKVGHPPKQKQEWPAARNSGYRWGGRGSGRRGWGGYAPERPGAERRPRRRGESGRSGTGPDSRRRKRRGRGHPQETGRRAGGRPPGAVSGVRATTAPRPDPSRRRSGDHRGRSPDTFPKIRQPPLAPPPARTSPEDQLPVGGFLEQRVAGEGGEDRRIVEITGEKGKCSERGERAPGGDVDGKQGEPFAVIRLGRAGVADHRAEEAWLKALLERQKGRENSAEAGGQDAGQAVRFAGRRIGRESREQRSYAGLFGPFQNPDRLPPVGPGEQRARRHDGPLPARRSWPVVGSRRERWATRPPV